MRQAPAGPPQRIDVRPGASLTMGSCPCADCGLDVVLTCRPGAWVRCVVTAHGDHWRLDNLCTDVEGVVVDQENAALQVNALPGRRRLVVPFEFAESVLPARTVPGERAGDRDRPGGAGRVGYGVPVQPGAAGGSRPASRHPLPGRARGACAAASGSGASRPRRPRSPRCSTGGACRSVPKRSTTTSTTSSNDSSPPRARPRAAATSGGRSRR
ncbi:hypothetical protein G5V59_13530 [Nocardioides sp. W3-2-3]|uniref:hypothetical protein n=1 Tax=Nocardioides convexus TaxID=2712224 RepID=UPI0024184246|nr:hypothetical protein [Nocardioides convexus]NHA00687.1 hypothetical protein [Nocardioides convexus]